MTLPDDSPIVSVAGLQAALAAAGDLRLIDARCDPVSGADPGAGRRAWLSGHLPGAVHVDLDVDLSDHRKQGLGRHPLPDDADFAQLLGRLGITPATPVVVYDSSDGALAAARMWWLLRLIGHRKVWVLDGGVAAWLEAGLDLDQQVPVIDASDRYPGQFDAGHTLTAGQVLARVGDAPGWLVDARAAARYAGEVEPIDPVAGHVPGAANLPYTDLLENGRLLSPTRIRQHVAQVLGDTDMHGRVLMCGSGVTACHVLLSLEHAGLSGALVYPGSWSGWTADPDRPVQRGLWQRGGSRGGDQSVG